MIAETMFDSITQVAVAPAAVKIHGTEWIEISGQTLRMSKGAYADLIKMAKLSKKAVHHIDSNIGRGTSAAIIHELFKSLTEEGAILTAYVNAESLTVQRFSNNDVEIHNNFKSGDLLNHLAESLERSHEDIQVNAPVIGPDGLSMNLSINCHNPITLGMEGEDIQWGKHFNWDIIDGLRVSDHIVRLACLNGQQTQSRSNYARLGTSPEEFTELYRSILQPSKDKIVAHAAHVQNARQTNLSVRELNTVMSKLLPYQDDMPTITQYLGDNRYRADYNNRGIELDALSTQQLANCPTPVNAWDAINCLTDLGSHKSKSNVSDYDRQLLQSEGGKLLYSGWDADNWVTAPSYSVQGPAVLTRATHN